MLNYWWVTRPKRKLDSIPAVLACCAAVAQSCEWQGNTYTHLQFEEELEKRGLKRVDERKDQRGGGGRTYFVWLSSLGLVFIQEETGMVKLTLAGEAIVSGKQPEEVLKNQVLKYQFPSPFSLSVSSSKTRVTERFKIRPFRFLLKLLCDKRIGCYLTQEEVGRVVAVEASDETTEIYEKVINRILAYREEGIASLSDDFFTQYAPSTGKVNIIHPYSHLDDLANTLINWLDYTGLIARAEGRIMIAPGKENEVVSIIHDNTPLIDGAESQEAFQRKYGLDLKHKEDLRSFD